MVQVRQLRDKRKVEAETAGWHSDCPPACAWILDLPVFAFTFGHVDVVQEERARKTEVDVEHLTRLIDDMELVLSRFQRMNPPTLSGAEDGVTGEEWLEHMVGLFDRVQCDEERRLSLATLQLIQYTIDLFMEVRTSMSYVSPSSSSKGSTRRFDLYIVYRPDPATSSCENS
ncbi:hypothetical protein F511_35667 [Dorcoceras hygrometricum]|uniref:Uncharacterized protein n=1 Tax=Dorcoceras hygrometricum TaxID=472368 RepID=A0A2Z7D632_9LAMI|nr:hypothetical protein F511_35667 [Dorcoceras hygrometricum]